MSSDPDALYRPLAGPGAWAAASSGVDGAVWGAGVQRLRALGEAAPAWTDMVRRGARLAAAYLSGGLAGLYECDDAVARRLAAGVATPSSCGPVAEPHVLANHAALLLAAGAAADTTVVAETWIRHLHAVACGPQVTHPVPTDHGVHDHVLGHGDYKHHPNHARTASGDWHALVPVAGVGPEMGRLLDALHGDAYAALHPAAQAAYALHGITHIGPFAAGNGRVARALAALPLLGAGSVPLVVPAARSDAYGAALAAADAGHPGVLVGFVEQQCAGLVDLVVELRATAEGPDESAALQRWGARARAAHSLHDLLPPAVEAALARHRRRTDHRWMSGLAGARVVATGSGADDSRSAAGPVLVQMAPAGGPIVEERLTIDAHPLTRDGNGSGDVDVLVLRAEGAELHIEVRADDVDPVASADLTGRLDALLDRMVTALAVRVAAGAED